MRIKQDGGGTFENIKGTVCKSGGCQAKQPSIWCSNTFKAVMRLSWNGFKVGPGNLVSGKFSRDTAVSTT